ncbi:MAG: hypothetical protein ACRDQ4_02670 [Pseudonocardiaceae bacterium]
MASVVCGFRINPGQVSGTRLPGVRICSTVRPALETGEGVMLYAFGFERVAVAMGDLYFVDPDPLPGQEGAERGVRLEVRLLEPGELKGSIYSARPIVIDRPVWRVDLLEAVASPPGSLDRAHHHPAFSGWEPTPRYFVDGLSTQPLEWVAAQLSDLDALLEQAGMTAADVGTGDAESLRAAVPEIADALGRLLDRVQAGQLAVAPNDERLDSARISWL